MNMTIIDQLKSTLNQYIIGKETAIELLLIALLAKGHVLIEDVPGIGKTTMVNALAKSLDLSFNRIQFTPDLMPSDITGFNLYNPKLSDFVFQPGAIMAQLVLADEINRSSPKTQSALLEAMQEYQVTVDQVTYDIPQPFMVLATQNPIEYVGTYPLPEAQLDRFMLKITLGYPNHQEELQILETYGDAQPLDYLSAIATRDQILALQEKAQTIYISDSLKAYLIEIIQATRNHPQLKLGASPRASLMLLKAAKARALIYNRDYVLPEDIQALVKPVLNHRVQISASAKLEDQNIELLLDEIINQIKSPRQ